MLNEKMKSPLSPIVRKVAGELVSKRGFTRPSQICLEEWWLSKPEGGEGLAVGGRPCEIQRCNNAQQKFQSAPAKRRFLSREFHTKVIKKMHGCTKLETSDGITITLCGLINTSRSIQNGYSSQVCRDFIYGFPYNWSDYAASAGEKSSQDNLKGSIECFKPAALDGCIGAQLHDMVLSHSDLEREVFNEKLYDNLIGIVSPQPMDGIERMSTPPKVETDVLKPESKKLKSREKKQRRQ